MNMAEFFKILSQSLTTPDCILSFAGLVLLGLWALRNRWGTRALRWSRPRKNYLSAYIVFAPFLGWIIAVFIASGLIQDYTKNLPEQAKALANNITMGIIEILIIIFMLTIANQYFTKKLSGLGFKSKSIGKDTKWSTVNLLAIWPVLVATILLSTHIGRMFYGPDYQLQQHEELKLLMEDPCAALITSVILLTIVIAPVFEEIMFRGLIQTLFRTHLRYPWPAIILTSVLFAIIHDNISHWPTLFTLAICLGYSYEKSGSLFRPIIIHMFFNAISVISTLLTASQ